MKPPWAFSSPLVRGPDAQAQLSDLDCTLTRPGSFISPVKWALTLTHPSVAVHPCHLFTGGCTFPLYR